MFVCVYLLFYIYHTYVVHVFYGALVVLSCSASPCRFHRGQNHQEERPRWEIFTIQKATKVDRTMIEPSKNPEPNFWFDIFGHHFFKKNIEVWWVNPPKWLYYRCIIAIVLGI